MKNRYYLLLLYFLTLSFAATAQSVGVGTTTPAASAAFDVTSTTKGQLLPRMTSAQRDAIANPAQGLFVLQTDGTPGLYYYLGSSWVNVVSGLIPDANGSAGPSPAIRVTTLAGTGTAGYADGSGATAQFRYPVGVAVDGSGNLYVADQSNNVIRKIVVATGVVSTLAGTGTAGYADGAGTVAQFSTPTGVAVDGSGGTVYVADRNNNRIRAISLVTGMVSTIAGSTQGFADGPSGTAQFYYPYGLTVDGSGNLYVADTNNQRIRKVVVATGAVSTLAGSGTAGFLNSTGTAAQFNQPGGVAVDGSGTNLYVADANNQRIRKIVVATGVVTTLAGSGTAGNADGAGPAAQFNGFQALAIDGSGTNLYVPDYSNHRIRKIVVATGAVSTLAGSGTGGYVNGTGTVAQFYYPNGVAVDGSGTLYVADFFNHRIRVVK